MEACCSCLTEGGDNKASSGSACSKLPQYNQAYLISDGKQNCFQCPQDMKRIVEYFSILCVVLSVTRHLENPFNQILSRKPVVLLRTRN